MLSVTHTRFEVFLFFPDMTNVVDAKHWQQQRLSTRALATQSLLACHQHKTAVDSLPMNTLIAKGGVTERRFESEAFVIDPG